MKAPEKAKDKQADQLIKLVTEGQAKCARALLKESPELGRANIFVASAVGEVEYVRAALRQNPKLAVMAGGPDNVVPLLYACCSGFLRLDAKLAKRVVAVVKLLLAHGADANAVFVTGPKENPWRLSALYGAAGRANHADLTKLLLKAGANPNDNESLYHSAEFKDLECTRLLLKHGAKIEGSNAVHRKLDYDDLPGLRLFLDHGASANLVGPGGNTILHWAITNGRGVKFLELLAERGADLRVRNQMGMTPFRLASAHGHVGAVKFLARRGAAEELGLPEQFIAACARGDGAAAKALLKQEPKLLKSLQAAHNGLLANFAWRGKTEAVRLMLDLGFDVAARGGNGETALHNAAWPGHLETVKILLKAGAPLEVKENCYQATAMGWALHGSVNARDSEGKPLNKGADYAGVLAALLKAGAKVPADSLTNLKDAVPADVLKVLERAGLVKE